MTKELAEWRLLMLIVLLNKSREIEGAMHDWRHLWLQFQIRVVFI